MMRKLLGLGVLAILAPVARAQDPLGPAYLPSIDTNPAHYPANIWVTDTMQKVRQDAGTPGNVKWGTFYGTQGEFIDFQVHVQAPSGGYSALNITASSFVQSSPNSFTIAAPDSSHNGTIVYREFYQDITTVTTTSPAYYNATGWYPDALIPTIDPYLHQTTNAFPVAVAANQNQSAWVDVFIPNNAPSGYYLGSITVKNGATTLTTLPIILAVWQWPSSSHMPTTSSLPTEFSMDWDDVCQQLYTNSANCNTNAPHASTDGGGGGTGGNVTTNAWAQAEFLDHRISVFDPLMSYTALATSNLLAGTTNTNFPPILAGVAATGVNYSTYLGSLSAWNTVVQVTNAATWPTVVPFYYPGACDEPSTGGFASCTSAIATGHALTPKMPGLITGTYANANASGSLNGFDYWTVENATLFTNATDGGGSNGTNNLPTYTAWKNSTNPSGITRQLWSYESCSSSGTCSNGTVGPNDFNYPNDNIDGRPSSNRAMEWMTFMNGQTGELLFEVFCAWPATSCYWSNSQPHDPWVSSYTFGQNGDATLMYPSTFTCSASMDYPQTNCPYASKNWVTQPGGAALTTPILIPSMRMKYKRDGMQDYEYLKKLTALGQGTFVNTQISSWITNLNTYEYTGSGLQTARYNLGTKLHQQTFAPTDWYYASAATGSNNGTSCANAYAYNDAVNGWTQATPQTAGNTLHICGTITFPAATNAFNFVNSGSSGSPITLVGEPGSMLSAPYWPGFTNGAFGAGVVGAVTSSGHSFITVTGVNIQATANGTNLANQKPSYGIYLTAGNHIIVSGNTVSNMYVHVCTGNSSSTPTAPCTVLNDEGGGDSLGIVLIGTTANPLGAVISGNTVHDVQLGTFVVFQGTSSLVNSSGSVTISGNTIYNTNISTQVGDGNGGSTAPAGSVHIVGNNWGSAANWDDNSDLFHHNCTHDFGGNSSSVFNSPWIYNNVCTGNLGWHMNSGLYIESSNGGLVSGPVVFNNVVAPSGPNGLASYGTINMGSSSSPIVVNNTVFGYSKSQTQANACISLDHSTSSEVQNNTCSTFGLGVLYDSVTTFGTISNNNWYNLTSFGYNGSAYVTLAQWQTATGGDASPPTTTTAPNYLTSSPWTPQTGSPLIGAGANLTYLCSSYAPLCSDINGVARPGSGAWDVGAANFTGTPIPGIPTGLAATVNNSTVSLTWSASSGTVNNYAVLRGTVSGGPYTQIATPATTSYSDTNLAANTYYYVVEACNSSGCSANSAEVQVTVQSQVSIPGVPGTLSVTLVNNNQANLAWGASTGTPANYKVLRATLSGGPYTQIATVNAQSLAYSDVGLANGTYFYVVEGCNSAGCSAASNQVTVTVATAPAINLTPSSYNYGRVLLGSTTATSVFSVKNLGNANLTLGTPAASISGANAADFTLTAGCSPGQVLAANTGCTLSVTFTPSIAGNEVASLLVSSNDPATPTDSVALTGTGFIGVTAAPTSLNFGNQFINKTSTAQTVTITNSSGSTMTFGSISLTTGTQFAITSNLCGGSGSTLASGLSCVISLTFTPTSTGNKTDTLTINWTVVPGSPIHIAISGLGKKHGNAVVQVGGVL